MRYLLFLLAVVQQEFADLAIFDYADNSILECAKCEAGLPLVAAIIVASASDTDLAELCFTTTKVSAMKRALQVIKNVNTP